MIFTTYPTYTYEIKNCYSWFDTNYDNRSSEIIDKLKKVLTYEKKQSIPKYELRLYEWIIKKQPRATSYIVTTDLPVEDVYIRLNGQPKYRGSFQDEFEREQNKFRKNYHNNKK